MDNSCLGSREVEFFFSQVYFPLKKKIPLFSSKKRVMVLTGPTAIGKTDLSLEIAEKVGGEIISADSMQVYRGMDIGTAKATVQQRRKIPHHLIDVCEVSSAFNVVQYYHLAKKVIEEIFRKGKVPIVVGGSGFYLQVLMEGPPMGPPPDYELRKVIEKKMEQLGPSVLYEQLQLLDPEYAKTIGEKDRHKIVRALEIITLSEKKVSDFQKQEKEVGSYNFRCWFLYYPKEILYPRIEKRCEQMLEKGFLREVASLKRAGLEKNLTASQAIGYKQALQFLKEEEKEEVFLQEFKKVSRNYAKRQFTWFRKRLQFRWLDLEKLGKEKVKELILQDYEQRI